MNSSAISLEPCLWTILELCAHAADMSVVSTAVRCECFTWPFLPNSPLLNCIAFGKRFLSYLFKRGT